MRQLTSSALWRAVPIEAGLVGLSTADMAVSSVVWQQRSYKRVLHTDGGVQRKQDISSYQLFFLEI